jgi:hypothetical protein
VGVRSILNKAEGMPEVVQAIRRALQERKRGALDADARESVRRAG